MAKGEIICARCETALNDPSKRLYSQHTKLHYCTNIDACSRRCSRNKRKATA